MGANHLTFLVAVLNIPWCSEMVVIGVGPVTRGEKGTQLKTFLSTPVSVKGVGCVNGSVTFWEIHSVEYLL